IGALLLEQQPNLGHFLTNDPKGKRIPEFISSLALHAVAERQRLIKEVIGLQKNIDHIKEVVSMQQAYATMVGTVEPLDPVAMMEDSLRMNTGALTRHEIQITRDFEPTPHALGEKAKVLQILVNLIRNSKIACSETQRSEKHITLRIRRSPAGD